MNKLETYKQDIFNVLEDIVRGTIYRNKAGQFDTNKEAEEFYRGLLNLVYGWNLDNANELEVNYEGVDLIDIKSENKIAVQVTTENSSEKVHSSIRGFKKKAFKEGCTELYVLMYKGKGEFPRVSFKKTIDEVFTFEEAFTFENKKHIIDHSDFCEKLRDAKFEYVKDIWNYLRKYGYILYADILEDVNEYDIIDEVFSHLLSNMPEKVGGYSTDSKIFTRIKIKVPLNFPRSEHKRLSQMIFNTTPRKLMVESYLSNYDDDAKISDLNELIQSKYCKVRGVKNPETPIQNIDFIEKLADSVLPKNRADNTHYQSISKAIILHFFEFCIFGKKTEDEKKQQQKSLFD